jgi:hypothetical protein
MIASFKSGRTLNVRQPPCFEKFFLSIWQAFCIVLMLTAASVFGLILGQLQEMFAVSNQRDRQMEDSIDSIFSFLQENKLVPVNATAVRWPNTSCSYL